MASSDLLSPRKPISRTYGKQQRPHPIPAASTSNGKGKRVLRLSDSDSDSASDSDSDSSEEAKEVVKSLVGGAAAGANKDKGKGKETEWDEERAYVPLNSAKGKEKMSPSARKRPKRSSITPQPSLSPLQNDDDDDATPTKRTPSPSPTKAKVSPRTFSLVVPATKSPSKPSPNPSPKPSPKPLPSALSPPKTPTRSRSRTSSPSPSPSGSRSPVKDLSKLFNAFDGGNGSGSGSDGEKVDKGKGKEVEKRKVSIMSGMGGRRKASVPVATDANKTFSPSPLSRSYSQPSPAPPTHSLQATQSLPPSPTKLPPSPSKALSRAPTLTTTTNPSQRTYGSTRTIRLDPTSTSFGLGASSTEKPRETYAALVSKWGLDLEDSDTLSSLSTGGESGLELSSVLQLRIKGDNNKWMDEFSYLVEGLSGEGGLRRTSAVEVVRKADKEFWKRVKVAGVGERLWKEFSFSGGGAGDRVMEVAKAILICQFAQDPAVAEPILRITSDGGESEVMSTLKEFLGRKWAKEMVGEGMKLSKGEGRLMGSLRDIIRKSELIRPTSSVTLRTLSLTALSTLSLTEPRGIFQPQNLICSSGLFEVVIRMFVEGTAGVAGRVKKYESGLDLMPVDDSIDLESLFLILQIFETCLASSALSTPLFTTHLPTLAPAFSSLILFLHLLLRTASPPSRTMDLLLVSLKLLGDLVMSDLEWSLGLAKEVGFVGTLVRVIMGCRKWKDVEQEEERDEEEGKKTPKELRLDLMCFALGLLENLGEVVVDTRDVLRETLIDPECDQRRCARTCLCTYRQSAVLCLTDLYLDPLCDLPIATASFVNGYTGMLLGLIMLDSPLNQTIVVDAIKHSEEATKGLVAAMVEFAVLHEKEEEQEGDSQTTEVEGQAMEPVEAVGVAVKIRKMVESFKERLE